MRALLSSSVDPRLRGRFRILGPLGEGAFGAVYLAETIGGGLARRVAIKIPHADRVTPELLERLRDEARLGAMIRHRAIVRVDDLVEADGTWAVVMEYVEGTDLADLVTRGPVPPRPALAIAEEVANALHAAWHQPGPDGRPLKLVHRDIKPSNLRLTAAGEVKVLDFGVARAEFASRETHDTQAVFGTATYLAPERYQGEDVQAGDVYAIGVTLFELLTGVPPGKSAFDADRKPPGRKLAAQWVWLYEVHPELPGLLASLLAEDPAERPSAREAARALARIGSALEGPSLEDWSEGVVPERVIRVAGDFRSGSLLLERPARRIPWQSIAGAGVLAVGIAIGLWWSRDPVVPAPVAPSAAQAVLASEDAPELALGSALGAIEIEPVIEPAVVVQVPSPVVTAAPTVRTTEPKPRPQRTATTGRIVATGDIAVVALKPSGRVGSDLAPGTYSAEVTLASGDLIVLDTIDVRAGVTTRLTCSGKFLRCKVE